MPQSVPIAGFSNLMYLHRFPVQQLKIDRSFVGQMLADLQVGVLTQAIISLGHGMGLTVIAEGVESENSLRALRNQGCDQVQGYHLTPPLPAAELAAWIRARGRPALVGGGAEHRSVDAAQDADQEPAERK